MGEVGFEPTRLSRLIKSQVDQPIVQHARQKLSGGQQGWEVRTPIGDWKTQSLPLSAQASRALLGAFQALERCEASGVGHYVSIYTRAIGGVNIFF